MTRYHIGDSNGVTLQPWEVSSVGLFVEHYPLLDRWVVGFANYPYADEPSITCYIKFLKPKPEMVSIVANATYFATEQLAQKALSDFRDTYGDTMVTRLKVHPSIPRAYGTQQDQEAYDKQVIKKYIESQTKGFGDLWVGIAGLLIGISLGFVMFYRH